MAQVTREGRCSTEWPPPWNFHEAHRKLTRNLNRSPARQGPWLSVPGCRARQPWEWMQIVHSTSPETAAADNKECFPRKELTTQGTRTLERGTHTLHTDAQKRQVRRHPSKTKGERFETTAAQLSLSPPNGQSIMHGYYMRILGGTALPKPC